MFWFIRALKSEMGFRLSHLPIGQVLVETYLMRPPPKFGKFKIFVNFSPRTFEKSGIRSRATQSLLRS